MFGIGESDDSDGGGDLGWVDGVEGERDRVAADPRGRLGNRWESAGSMMKGHLVSGARSIGEIVSLR